MKQNEDFTSVAASDLNECYDEDGDVEGKGSSLEFLWWFWSDCWSLKLDSVSPKVCKYGHISAYRVTGCLNIIWINVFQRVKWEKPTEFRLKPAGDSVVGEARVFVCARTPWLSPHQNGRVPSPLLDWSALESLLGMCAKNTDPGSDRSRVLTPAGFSTLMWD